MCFSQPVYTDVGTLPSDRKKTLQVVPPHGELTSGDGGGHLNM